MNDVTDILVGVDKLLSEHGFCEMASARHQLSIAISLHKQQLQQARREGWEQVKEESRRTIQQLEAMNKALTEHISKGIMLQPAPVMLADAAARRMGWEQGKREAEGIADTYFRASQINGHRSEIARKITKAIAAMEYGGEK